MFVGAGDGPSVILMAAAPLEDEHAHYPVSELAVRYSASVEEGVRLRALGLPR